MKKIQNFTWSGRKKKDSVFITFIRICEKNSEIYLLDPEESNRMQFYYFYKDLDLWEKKFRTLITWSRIKKPDSVFITFVRICVKKFRALLTWSGKNGLSFINFILICGKKIWTLLTWSGRKKPDSVFITFVQCCGSGVDLDPHGIHSEKILDIIKNLCFTWRPGPSSW